MKYILLFFLFHIGLSSGLQYEYESKTLKTKDYEEMREILYKVIKKSQTLLDQNEGQKEAIIELKKGLKLILMKPNDSLMLLHYIQNEISKYRSFMKVFSEVVQNSLDEIASNKGSVAYQASLIYLLENALSFLQSFNNKESTLILKTIKTSKIKISSKVASYLLVEMGRGETASPSYLANKMLKPREILRKKELAKKQMAMKKEAKRIKQTKKLQKKVKKLTKQAEKEEKSERIEQEKAKTQQKEILKSNPPVTPLDLDF